MHFLKIRPIVAATGNAACPGRDVPIGAASGSFGGIVASMNGVGIDMIIYAILALLYRADLTESVFSTARRVPHPVPER